MHIALVTPSYTPLPRGGERYAAALASHLVKRGHRVTVVTGAAASESDLWLGTTSDVREERDADGVEIRRCPIRPFPGGRWGLMQFRRAMIALSLLPGDATPILRRMAAAVPPIRGIDDVLQALPSVDVVHAFNISWECAMVAADRLARDRGLPLVLTPYAHLGARKGDRVARNSTMDHQLDLLRRAARVLVLTDFERDGLIEYGLERGRVHTIGGGLDPLPGDLSGSTFLQPGALPERYALFIGRVTNDKGAVDAAAAALALRREGYDISLLLVGAIQEDFANFHAALPPPDQVAIRPLGVVSEIDKHALLSRAQMLLLPSRSDSFGIVFLEAWAYGRPVIGARAGGIPGVVDDGDNGFLVEYGDVAGLTKRMRLLFDDDALATRMGERGREKVRRDYVWEAVAARVDGHYQAVIRPAA